MLSFYKPWKQYVFSSHDECVFNDSCLRDVLDFMKSISEETAGERMNPRMGTTGRGKKMPIAKAALVWFFEGWKDGDCCRLQPESWDWGDYGVSHEIVDIAGAENVGPNTTFCVSRALGRSPLWSKKFCRGFYAGISNGVANIYTPNDAGKKWYEKWRTKR